MGKFHSYAQRLDEAFKTARDEYAASYAKLQQAEQERKEAGEWFQEKYIGERAARKARAEANFLEAKAEFEAAAPRAWSTFNEIRRAIRAELEAEVKKNGLVSASAVDSNALELMKSGVMTADDYCKFATDFDSNPTMLKLVSKFALEAAENTDVRADRGALLQVAEACKDGQGRVMREWDDLSRIADYCAGQAHGRPSAPAQVISMASHWEELTGEAVENF